MKGVEGTPEEQERLATGNNNGSLDCKHTEPDPGPMRKCSVMAFMLVYLSGWVMQGMFLTYFVSVTTTIEKLFKVESKTTGTLLAGTEIGQICTTLFLTYLAGQGHRPRWIASMMLVLAVGVISCMLPHLLYGTQVLDVHPNAHRAGASPVCYSYQNSSELCDDEYIISSTKHSSITAVVIPWLFISLLVVGVGQTGIATLGIPFLDDNVPSHDSPIFVSITVCTRILGPAFGFVLGALCTSVYVNPLVDPGFDSSDPRWVGAWWLGMVVIAFFIVLLSILMFYFPRQIEAEPEPVPLPLMKIKDEKEPLDRGFFATMKRLLTNKILMLRTASTVFHLMPVSGLYSFLPKYLEKQFRLQTHDANLVTGLGGILVMGFGSFLTGVVIKKMVPTARAVAAWTAGMAAIYSLGMVVLMFVSCPEENYRMISDVSIANSKLNCSSGCYCSDVPFNPVCGQDSFTYLSPCQAGCLSSQQLDNSSWVYYNCSCIDSEKRGKKAMQIVERHELFNQTDNILSRSLGFAVSGACDEPCKEIYLFIGLFATLMFLHSTSEVGSLLLVVRCTDREDKTMAMGVITFAMGVFGNVPCPILFGTVVDAACRTRDVLCGVLGACVAYDNESFRYHFLGLSSILMVLACITDLLVWSRVGELDMNPAYMRAKPDAAGDAEPDDTQL